MTDLAWQGRDSSARHDPIGARGLTGKRPGARRAYTWTQRWWWIRDTAAMRRGPAGGEGSSTACKSSDGLSRAPAQACDHRPRRSRGAPAHARDHWPRRSRGAPARARNRRPRPPRGAPAQARGHRPRRSRGAPAQARGHRPRRSRGAPAQALPARPTRGDSPGAVPRPSGARRPEPNRPEPDVRSLGAVALGWARWEGLGGCSPRSARPGTAGSGRVLPSEGEAWDCRLRAGAPLGGRGR